MTFPKSDLGHFLETNSYLQELSIHIVICCSEIICSAVFLNDLITFLQTIYNQLPSVNNADRYTDSSFLQLLTFRKVTENGRQSFYSPLGFPGRL